MMKEQNSLRFKLLWFRRCSRSVRIHPGHGFFRSYTSATRLAPAEEQRVAEQRGSHIVLLSEEKNQLDDQSFYLSLCFDLRVIH